MTDKKLVIMVSSCVYGVEELLERIYATLTEFGYEVWMSHKGTVPVLPHMTAFDSCLEAVDRCDLFLCLITPQYGSGKDEKDLSITHRELLGAIDKNKPRWILAHDYVVFARTLLINLGYATAKDREALSLKKNQVFGDLRVIDMYEAAIRHDINLKDRKGNWVQKYISADDALLYASAQFYRYGDVERFLSDHFKNSQAVSATAGGKKLDDD